jgi:CheY-like chemotaxis protein/nitrogen-specific signal transduction histidine kinase
MTQDLDERVAVEAELRAAKAEAERLRAEAEAASRAKDYLIAAVSHELRSPLTPARVLAQLLASDATLTPEQRATAAEIESHIAVEARLIDDLFEFSRAVRGELQLRLEPTDVHDAVRSAVSVSAGVLKARHVNVVERLDAADSVVMGDPVRLRQVVWNLVQNAAIHSPPGSDVTICTTNPEAGALVIDVDDEGFGIPPDQLERIFEGFARVADGVRRITRPGSLGLGLAISRRIAEVHGGTLTAQSAGRGHGAVFTLRLGNASRRPTSESAAPTHSRPRQRYQTRSRPPGTPSRTVQILLVEDDASTAKALNRFFAAHGQTIHHASSLAAAERAASALRFDVVVCDLQLPDGNGLDLVRRLHARDAEAGRRPLPAVALSGFAGPRNVEAALAAGFAACLAKPVDGADLLAAIAGAIE